MTILRHLAACALLLAVGAGNLAACDGWSAAPEARMACCSDAGGCPMHAPEARDSGAKRIVMQADADRCCATAGREGASPAPVALAAASTPIVLLPTLPVVSPPAAALALDQGGPSPPADHGRVPRHLLLSVFLV